MNTTIQRYKSEINKINLFTKQEEIEFGNRVMRGDKIARTKFIEANLRLVVKIALKFYYCSEIQKQDIIQQGNIGLIDAVDNFDVNRGCKFSTFASRRILASILDFLKKSSLIVLPRYMRQEVNRLLKIDRECGIFLLHNERLIPSFVNEFNKRYTKWTEKGSREYTAKDIKTIMENYKFLSIASLYCTFGDSEGMLIDRIEDLNAISPLKIVSDIFFHKEISLILDKLDYMERFIIVRYFDLDGKGKLTLIKIGSILCIKRDLVWRKKVHALKEIKNMILLNT